jgi:tetratricopeptide (TPR) repeat protein
MWRSSGVLTACVALGVAGCGFRPSVDRAYEGSVVRGRFVEPEAYAAFLRGAMAQAAGDSREALAAYEDARRADGDSPEIWTRIGEVRCALDARAGEAERDFARALDLDPRYARAWSARARCALSRGDAPGARAAAEQAAALDPSADGANVLLTRAAATGGSPADAAGTADVRQRLLALTSTARDPLTAWEALAAWAEAQGDVPLWARALRETVRLAPGRRVAVATAAQELAGAGDWADARAVAAAAVDADPGPFGGQAAGGCALAVRLAVDDAIARADLPLVRRRATRVRVPLDEAAGRALLAGSAAMARTLATEVADGDPTARGARLVLAAASGDNGSVVHAAFQVRPGDAPVSSAALVSFGQALSHSDSPEEAREALSAIPHADLIAGDALVVRPAVQLVARGALGAALLPPDGAVELAALRGEAPPEPLPRLDARHEYLALAAAHPDAPRARELAARLAPAASSDPVVAAAASLLRLAHRDPPPDAQSARALLAIDPADPLLAAIALRLADRVGDADAARRARAALAAFRYTGTSAE